MGFCFVVFYFFFPLSWEIDMKKVELVTMINRVRRDLRGSVGQCVSSRVSCEIRRGYPGLQPLESWKPSRIKTHKQLLVPLPADFLLINVHPLPCLSAIEPLQRSSGEFSSIRHFLPLQNYTHQWIQDFSDIVFDFNVPLEMKIMFVLLERIKGEIPWRRPK